MTSIHKCYILKSEGFLGFRDCLGALLQNRSLDSQTLEFLVVL